MARSSHIRGTRSRAPYGYARDGKPQETASVNLLAWILLIIFLSAMTIFAWIVPAYIFRNPHIPLNYDILRKMGKLEDLKAFSSSRPPRSGGKRSRFFKARQLFDEESGRPDEQLTVINEAQKRLYVQNYIDGKMLGYITGEFEIIETRPLGDEDLFTGLALRALSKEFPNTVLEYLLPIPGEFTNPYKPGDTLKIRRGGDLAAILHLAHLPEDRLSITAISLTYADEVVTKEEVLDVELPKDLNLHAKWPAFEGPVALPSS